MLLACFYSLVWSGQATSQSQKLSHEGRVFIHTALSRHFPFLLLCQGGQWKINELIIQNYSSFAKMHLSRKKSRKEKSSKRRQADSSSGESVGGVDAPPAKVPKVSNTASHGSPILSSLLPSPSTNPSSHLLLEPGANLFVLNNPSQTDLLSPSPASHASFHGPTDDASSAPITTLSLPPLAMPSSSLPSAPSNVFQNAHDTTSAPDTVQNPLCTNTHKEGHIIGGQCEAPIMPPQAPADMLAVSTLSFVACSPPIHIAFATAAFSCCHAERISRQFCCPSEHGWCIHCAPNPCPEAFVSCHLPWVHTPILTSFT